MAIGRKRKRVLFRRKRTLDPNTAIDYKDADGLKRFITDRGKIIPRRISGANASQQREICTAIKRARYLSLLPFSVAHRQEKKVIVDAALAAAAASARSDRRPVRRHESAPSTTTATTETTTATTAAATATTTAPDSGSSAAPATTESPAKE